MNKRIFLDNPDAVAGIEFGEVRQATVERTLVMSDFFGPPLPAGRILVQHHCWYRPVKTPVKTHLALGRAAGYRLAVYGAPDVTFPVLFEHPDNPNLLISSTLLANHVRGRFAPQRDWRTVMGRIAAFLDGKDDIADIDWVMSVRPRYAAEAELPGDVEAQSLQRNITWFLNHMLYDANGKTGVFEGYVSAIDPEGRQLPCARPRGDCTGESAIIPALDWSLNRNYSSRDHTLRILDFLFNKLTDNNPRSPTYGANAFYENEPAFYGAGNMRAAMGSVLASELIGDDRFAPHILRCMLSMLRTTGRKGFRRPRLENPASFAGGKNWTDFQQEDFVHCHPHYHSSTWAGFIQAYVLTGHHEFLDKSKTAIAIVMEAFPDWRWTNGITQEYARMLLSLAYLVQVEDTPRHRGWLRAVAGKLLENRVACGAIRDMMGEIGKGNYPSPRANDQYGAAEASLIQENGDPACDLLYTANYAFIGLHEAACATGESVYRRATDRLADFLCRVQVTSIDQPYLDGSWMRGFDYELWEHYGSSSDRGWGAWSVEAGWTNTWIPATLALRAMNRSLLCREQSERYRRCLPDLLEEMAVVHTPPGAAHFSPAAARGDE